MNKTKHILVFLASVLQKYELTIIQIFLAAILTFYLLFKALILINP